MDTRTTLVTRPADPAGRVKHWRLATLGAFVAAVLLGLVGALGAGVLIVDLLAPEAETILAAPFRWN